MYSHQIHVLGKLHVYIMTNVAKIIFRKITAKNLYQESLKRSICPNNQYYYNKAIMRKENYIMGGISMVVFKSKSLWYNLRLPMVLIS